jgi:hypothetical protein
LLSALRALHGHFDALSHSRRLRRGNSSQPFILGLLAGLAALGFVFESLIVKENLLARSPNKVFVTIYTLDWAIQIFCFSIRFQGGGGFHLYHVLLP